MDACEDRYPEKQVFVLLRLVTLFYIESQHEFQFIAKVFGYKDKSNVSRVINDWLPIFGEVGQHLSILPFINARLIDDLEPESYVELGLRKVAANIDGKDWYTDTVRKDRSVSTVQQENILGKSSIRLLTWSLPCGLNFEHTCGVFARATEKHLVHLWGKKNVPIGNIVFGDKGFDGTSGCYPTFNTIIHPAFLYGNSQFAPEQIGWKSDTPARPFIRM